MAGIRAEPFVSFCRRLKADELLVRHVEKVPGLLNQSGIDAGVRQEILLGHDQGIARPTGLLKTAVRLTQQRLQRVGHAGQWRGIHSDVGRNTSADHIVRNRELESSAAIRRQHSTGRVLVRETQGLNIERSTDAVVIIAGRCIQREVGQSREFATDFELHETTRTLFRSKSAAVIAEQRNLDAAGRLRRELRSIESPA